MNTKTILLLLMVTNVRLEEENCYFNDFCDPDQLDTEIIGDEETNSIAKCQNKCDESEGCNYFSFFKFRGSHSCFFLQQCSKKVKRCLDSSSCTSGPSNCVDSFPEYCSRIEVGKEQGQGGQGGLARWNCKDINLYKQGAPVGQDCQISCPSWKTTNGNPAIFESMCQINGSWSNPAIIPSMSKLLVHRSINPPGEEENPCTCNPLQLNHNPNTEPGTRLSCSTNIDLGDDGGSIEPDNECLLTCSGVVEAWVMCQGGVWTGQQHLGMYCYFPPEGQVTPTRRPTQPVENLVAETTQQTENGTTSSQESEVTEATTGTTTDPAGQVDIRGELKNCLQDGQDLNKCLRGLAKTGFPDLGIPKAEPMYISLRQNERSFWHKLLHLGYGIYIVDIRGELKNCLQDGQDLKKCLQGLADSSKPYMKTGFPDLGIPKAEPLYIRLRQNERSFWHKLLHLGFGIYIVDITGGLKNCLLDGQDLKKCLRGLADSSKPYTKTGFPELGIPKAEPLYIRLRKNERSFWHKLLHLGFGIYIPS